MAAEHSAIAQQTVEANQPIIFTETTVPDNAGYIFHREGSGLFRLATVPRRGNCTCCCCRRRYYETLYMAGFHANIALPTDGTVGPIQLALVIDGEIDPVSIMITTPEAVETFKNVGTSVIVPVPSICRCSSLSVRNISTQSILVQNANLIIAPAGFQSV